MKKLLAFLCSILIVILCIVSIKAYLNYRIHYMYYGKVGDITTDSKFTSIALQNEGIRQDNNLFMFGSSEFESASSYSTHASKFFNNKKDGFQINLIGRAGYKSLVHSIDIGALSNEYKDQKLVFVLSPQWFSKAGIDQNTFLANSTEALFWKFMLNNSLSRDIKQRVAKRLIDISIKNPNEDYSAMWKYCRLYSKDSFLYKASTTLLYPYYKMRYYILSLKDSYKAYLFMKQNKEKLGTYDYINSPHEATFDWDLEKTLAVENAKKYSHNEFGMDDAFYNDKIKGDLEKLKGSFKNNSYSVSPEYDDFNILLDICKESGLDLLVVNIPVNGPYYDYCGFSKSDREAYYKRVKAMTLEHGFEMADFSDYEYDTYFLKDASHLGWKGWVYVNEAIDKFYKQGKK